jgi:hypothetical protein
MTTTQQHRHDAPAGVGLWQIKQNLTCCFNKATQFKWDLAILLKE